MAIKSYNPFQPGFRLINGTHLNNLFQGVEYLKQIAVSGTATVVGLLTASGGMAITGNSTVTGNTSQTGYAADSVAGTLTAAGTNRATALVISHQINDITTAAASTGAVLPLGTAVGLGAAVTIFNDGASAITVYAAGSDTIDGTAGATGVALTNAKRCSYYPVTVSAGNTAWISAQLGVVSA